MSTQIENAYRLRAGNDLWSALASLRTKAEKGCREILEDMYPRMLKDRSWSGDIRSTLNLKGAPNFMDVSRFLRTRFEHPVSPSDRDMYDLRVEVGINKDGRRFLLRAFTGSGLFSRVLDFMKASELLEDFHYQDRSDRDDGISGKAWASRKRSWGRVMDDGGYPRNELVLDISTPQRWHRIDPAIEMMVRSR